MIRQVGQFEVIVTQLNNTSNPNGLYSGLESHHAIGNYCCVYVHEHSNRTDQKMYAGR